MYSLLPYNRREANLFHFMDDMERSFLNPSINGMSQFRCDIAEKDGQYLLSAELPGFNKEDIDVDVENGMLTISATHSEQNDEKDEDGNYIRRERRFGSFSRSFNAEGIDVQHIKANYNNGVLTLEMPKLKELPKTSHKVAIGGDAADKAEEPKKVKAAKPAKASKSPKITVKGSKTEGSSAKA